MSCAFHPGDCSDIGPSLNSHQAWQSGVPINAYPQMLSSAEVKTIAVLAWLSKSSVASSFSCKHENNDQLATAEKVVPDPAAK